jgi:metal-responsive CopG/Arc/MetJ family transcriptional regulator
MIEEVRYQVNAEMDKKLIEMLDAMRKEDEQSRSGFIRVLIKAEYKRRQSQILLPETIKAV